eukprot:XP_001706923.1 Hypothetical protein GL50803_36865 [Giardia lamblia ATCC 50803]
MIFFFSWNVKTTVSLLSNPLTSVITPSKSLLLDP